MSLLTIQFRKHSKICAAIEVNRETEFNQVYVISTIPQYYEETA